MAAKIFKQAPGLLVLMLCALATYAPLWGQPGSVPVVHTQCSKVFLTSDDPRISVRLIEPFLRKREDFRASKLVLTDDEEASEVSVRLRRSNIRGTSILVINLATGNHAIGSSPWTDYPGMIAVDVMNEIRQVCPGSIVAPPIHQKVVAAKREPISDLAMMDTLAACSRTSWMDERELSRALLSSDALKRWGIHIRPTCDLGGTRLEVTHNLELTVEWRWELKSAKGETITQGRTIAFASRDAAQQIAESLAREISRSHGDRTANNMGIAEPDARREISGRTVRVKFMPTDFSMYDTRIVLSIDSERISARELDGRLLFSFPTEDLRDVRLRKVWDPMFPLAGPTFVVGPTKSADTQSFKPLSVPEEDWSASYMLPANYMVGLIGYFALGAIVAPFKIPTGILDLVWEEDGQPKTVSLQLPAHESGRLLRGLRAAICADPSQSYGDTRARAASKR